jgi:hypothetical protein
MNDSEFKDIISQMKEEAAQNSKGLVAFSDSPNKYLGMLAVILLAAAVLCYATGGVTLLQYLSIVSVPTVSLLFKWLRERRS